jgi:hypothetical protein
MTDAEALAAALLAAGDPHSFRDGSLLVTVGGFHAEGNVLTVERVEATFAGSPVTVDCPYLYVDAPVGADALAGAHTMIAGTVRHGGL